MTNRIVKALLLSCLLPVLTFSAKAEHLFTEGKNPELDRLVAAYLEKDREIDSEIEPRVAAARDKYIDDLDRIMDDLNEKRRPDEVEKIQKGIKRYQRTGMKGAPANDQPSAVKLAWTAMTRSVETAEAEVRPKREGIRTQFLRGLSEIETSLRQAKDAEGLVLALRARACINIRGAIEKDRLATTEIFGSKDAPWKDVAGQGGYVVGFQTNSGQWWEHRVLGEMKPVFETLEGLAEGSPRGNNGGEIVLAKKGYAVGGLSVRSGDVVNAVQIIFMRINADGMSLDPKDSYLSDWLGGKGGGKPKDISGRGRMVVGVTGNSGDIIDGLGLVFLR